MKQNFRPELVTKPLFVIGLLILTTNDIYLKYEFSNALTGKLSDFAGLLIFPYFLSALMIRFSKYIYCFTAVSFAFWKLPLAQNFIEWVNYLGIPIYRTIDYTDLIALLILPFSYYYFNIQASRHVQYRGVTTVIVSVISVLAFCATTLPKREVAILTDTNRSYQLAMSKADFFNTLTPGHPYSGDINKDVSDTLFYLTYEVPEYHAQIMALAVIKQRGLEHTNVTLDSVLFGVVEGGLFSGVSQDDINRLRTLKPKDLERQFERNFIELVISKNAKYLYYDNKKIHDSFQ